MPKVSAWRGEHASTPSKPFCDAHVMHMGPRQLAPRDTCSRRCPAGDDRPRGRRPFGPSRLRWQQPWDVAAVHSGENPRRHPAATAAATCALRERRPDTCTLGRAPCQAGRCCRRQRRSRPVNPPCQQAALTCAADLGLGSSIAHNAGDKAWARGCQLSSYQHCCDTDRRGPRSTSARALALAARTGQCPGSTHGSGSADGGGARR
jgi:hypothetical protein